MGAIHIFTTNEQLDCLFVSRYLFSSPEIWSTFFSFLFSFILFLLKLLFAEQKNERKSETPGKSEKRRSSGKGPRYFGK